MRCPTALIFPSSDKASPLRSELGQDELLGKAVPMGAHGGVNGGANFAPRLFSRLYDAARRGDAVEVARLKPLTESIVQIIYDGAPSPSRVILGIKAALKTMGIGNGRMIEPYADARIELPRVQQVLDEINATVKDYIRERRTAQKDENHPYQTLYCQRPRTKVVVVR